VQFWDVYYGTAHFLVTAAMLVAVSPPPQPLPVVAEHPCRGVGAGPGRLVVFPLMPPRLLDDCGRVGDCARYGFTDTLRRVGGLWSFESTTMAQSVQPVRRDAESARHLGDVVRCGYVAARAGWRARLALAAYPLATIFAIMVTANHYLLDAVGAAVILAAGYLMAASVRRFGWGVRRGGRANRP